MRLTTLLWLLDASALGEPQLAGYLSWLSPSELERHGRFTRPARQRQFIAGRILLRRALGALLGTDGADIILTEQPGAAPRLVRPASESIGFSISHSGRWVACAASLESKLGLDIEVIDPTRDIAALAGQAFDARQIAWFNDCPEAERTGIFYALWCAQEAGIKLGQASAACFQVRHADLAIALCSAQRLEQAPRLELQAW